MNLSWLSLADPNTQWVLAGTMLLGLSAGVLGSFALLRRRSLMGDALAHAALPGVCIAYLIVGAKSSTAFLMGAGVAGVIGTVMISLITRYSKIKVDTAMAVVLTVFFGIGIMLLSVIQRSPQGNQSGLDTFLFGQAAAMVGSDVTTMVAISAFLCLAVLLLFKEFKLLAFDASFGAGLGLPMGLLDLLLNLLIVLAVVIGLQSVGVILMAAMLISPAIAARYWTDRLHIMVVLAALFGALSGSMGTLLSQAGPRMPTGPLIVLSATAIFLFSLFLAPGRGLVSRMLRHLRTRRRVARESLLRALYELAEEAGESSAPVTAQLLQQRRGLEPRSLHRLLNSLAAEGLVDGDPGAYRLTPDGLRLAHRLVHDYRLWEVFLMHQADLGHLQIDPDAIDMPEAIRTELEGMIQVHGLRPALLPQGGKERV